MTAGQHPTGDDTLVALGLPRPPDWRAFTRAVSRALSRVPPTGLLLLAIVSVQLGSVLAIHLFATLGPNATVFLRVAFGALLLAIAAPPQLDAGLLKHWRLLALLGIVIAIQNLAFFHAIARIPLGIAVTIEFLGPLGVAVFNSRRPLDLLWVGLAAAGIALLTPEIGGTLDPWGVVFAGITGCAWAGFILLGVRVGQAVPGGRGLSAAMAVAAVVLLPFAGFGAEILTVAPAIVLAVLAVALLSTTIPTVLEFEALKTMPLRKHGIILAIEPVVAMMVGALLLSEALEPRGLLAAAAVMLAAIGATFSGMKGR